MLPETTLSALSYDRLQEGRADHANDQSKQQKYERHSTGLSSTMLPTSSSTLREIVEYLPPNPLPSVDERIQWWQARVNSSKPEIDVATSEDKTRDINDNADTIQRPSPSSSKGPQPLSGESEPKFDGDAGIPSSEQGSSSPSSDSMRTMASSRSSMLEADIEELKAERRSWEDMLRILTDNNEELKRENQVLKVRVWVAERMVS